MTIQPQVANYQAHQGGSIQRERDLIPGSNALKVQSLYDDSINVEKEKSRKLLEQVVSHKNQ